MNELIVVAAHGPNWIDQCRESLKAHAPYADVLVVDTGSHAPIDADVVLDGGHPTGAYLWAYEHCLDFDRFLFMQDSMTAVFDPLPWFREKLTDGVAAWAKFEMQWDNDEQLQRVVNRYPDAAPSHGIMGPVFYTSREVLDQLKEQNLLPAPVYTKIDAKGTERAWAYALATAGLSVTGPEWDYQKMQTGFGPFKKVWADRP